MRRLFITPFILSLLLAGSCVSDKPGKNKSGDLNYVLTAPEADQNYFQEIAMEIGLDFRHSIGDDHLSNLVESVGGGAVFLDYDLAGADGNCMVPVKVAL